MNQTVEKIGAAQAASLNELEARRDASSVLLLREMAQAEGLQQKRELFEQAADQESSHISEVLKGKVSTRFDFEVSDGRLYFLQPGGVTSWEEMHQNGLARAEALALDPNYAFYRDLSEAELNNARRQEELIAQAKPFAMIELSLAGTDLASPAVLRDLGRDPDLARAFLRTSVYDGSGFHIYSESIDGLSPIDGRGIATGWGMWSEAKVNLGTDATSVDILKAPIILTEVDLAAEDMHHLPKKLVEAYDDRLLKRTGQRHSSGRRLEDSIHTYEFVLNNPDLVNAHMEGLCDLAASDLDVYELARLANDLRYDIMSSFKKRMNGTWVDKGSLAESVADAGAAERANGTTFYGCDTAVSASANLAPNAGYANANEGQKSLMELAGKAVRCANKDCGKKVIIPSKDLERGVLSCSECGLHYDVCTKKSWFEKAISANQEELSPLAKWNREYDQNQAIKKAERLAKEADLAKAA